MSSTEGIDWPVPTGLTDDQRNALVGWLTSDENDGGWHRHSARSAAWAFHDWLESAGLMVVQKEMFDKAEAAYVLQQVRAGNYSEVPLEQSQSGSQGSAKPDQTLTEPGRSQGAEG